MNAERNVKLYSGPTLYRHSSSEWRSGGCWGGYTVVVYTVVVRVESNVQSVGVYIIDTTRFRPRVYVQVRASVVWCAGARVFSLMRKCVA